MTYSWGNLWRLPFTWPTAGPAGRSAIVTLLIFGVATVGFAGATVAVEVALGQPLSSAETPGYSHSLLDAAWHLATAFVLVLPARRYVGLWLAPTLALGLDVDHLFGGVLPTVTYRTAHDLLFVVIIGALLYWTQGRSAAFFASGAVLAHIAVDGGAFPLWGPLSVAYITPPLAALLVLLVAGSVLFFLAGREVRELWSSRSLLSVGVACAAIGLLLAFIPQLSTFIGQ